MSEKERIYKIFDRETGTWLTVSKEDYINFYRSVWKYQKDCMAKNECYCPQRFLYKCDANCLYCEFYRRDYKSLDEPVGTSGAVLGDSVENPDADIETVFFKKLLLQKLYEELDKLSEPQKQVMELYLAGKNDTEIKIILGFSSASSVPYHREKAFEKLRLALEEYI